MTRGTFPTRHRPSSPWANRDPREVGGQWPRFQQHWYGPPGPDLAWCVARYWAARWDYRGQPPYRQLIVPYPNVQLSFLAGEPARVYGVARGHVFRWLAGTGQVFGVAFRPGCLRPFLDRPVATLTDRWVAATDLLGPEVPGWGEAGWAQAAEPALVRVVEGFLGRVAPPPDPIAQEVAGMVELVAAAPRLRRVGDLATRVGAGVRQLQRLFAEYVGVGPKWVIRRYRLHEVTERLANGQAVDWAGLAAELGYADQAHLTRDVTALVGEPPTVYAARYPPQPSPSG